MLRKKPLRTLPPPRRAELREKLRAPNNLNWLLTFICTDLRDHLLRAFPPPDPPTVVGGLIKRLGRLLAQAVLDKLARYYPHDASKGFSALVRYHPDETGELVNQALCYLRDVWGTDFISSPRGTLATRVARLTPRLSVIPSRKGRSNIGATYQLYCLHVYEKAYFAVKEALGVKAWKSDDVRPREELLQERKAKLAQLFPEATARELDTWAVLSPSEIAYRLAAKRAKELPSLKPSYLKQTILPRARHLAQALDKALARQQIRSS